jgi:uncharacterized protein YqjF (DUF2071 family)
VLLTTTVRNLLLATWAVPPAHLRHSLPAGVEPDLDDDGSALVSLAAARAGAVRVDGFPVPGFGHLAVRTYVRLDGKPSLFLLALRVTTAGLPGAFYGIPVRPARIRVRTGAVVAPGLGAELRYRVGAAVQHLPTAGGVPLGSHVDAGFLSAGVRSFHASHAAPAWQEAALVAPPRLEPLIALGFDAREPDSLLYAESVQFGLTLPTEKVADSAP